MFFFLYMMMCLSWIYMKFFSKKLIVLLSIEGLMLCIIAISQFFKNLNFSSFLLLMIFSIFMVLDSVFGISVLISSSRNTSFSNKLMY